MAGITASRNSLIGPGVQSLTVAAQMLIQELSSSDIKHVEQLLARWLELAMSEVPSVPPHGGQVMWPHHGDDALACNACSCDHCLVGAA